MDGKYLLPLSLSEGWDHCNPQNSQSKMDSFPSQYYIAIALTCVGFGHHVLWIHWINDALKDNSELDWMAKIFEMDAKFKLSYVTNTSQKPSTPSFPKWDHLN